MSAITIFNNSKAMIGQEHFEYNDDSVALVECDDKYDEKALDLVGRDDAIDFSKKSKNLKFFCEVTFKN